MWPALFRDVKVRSLYLRGAGRRSATPSISHPAVDLRTPVAGTIDHRPQAMRIAECDETCVPPYLPVRRPQVRVTDPFVDRRACDDVARRGPCAAPLLAHRVRPATSHDKSGNSSRS